MGGPGIAPARAQTGGKLVAMSLLQQGFGEIGRKLRRVALGRRIKGAARARATALRALGRRAFETGTTGPASGELIARLAGTQERDRQLASQQNSLDENAKRLEQQRDADEARYTALEREVQVRKGPLDAELAAQQKAAAQSRQQIDDTGRRLAHAQKERQSLETALRRPAGEGAADFNRPQAEARLAALQSEQQQLEATQTRFAEAGSVASREIERLKAAIAPLQAEQERIRAERKQASDGVKKALDGLRRQSKHVRSEAVGVSHQRDLDFEELGGVLAAAGVAAPALAAEQGAVAAAEQALAALQSRYDGSLADSRALPKFTMAKFGALMTASVLAVGGVAYAATKAVQALRPARPEAEDCTMTYEKRDWPQVQANPGGPYRVTRGGRVTLDGSKSKGKCLRYTWTFAAAPGESGGGTRGAGSPEDASIFAYVAQMACPEGTSGNPGARKEGQKAPTDFLCSLTATLTVTDGNTSDSKDVLVKVLPRGPAGWQTSVDQAQAETYLPGSRLVIEQLEMGKNVCALDDSPAHALHAGKSWLGEGFSVETVKDPRGPFDEWWYIGASTLRIKRAAQLNQDLAANSELHKKNIAKGYQDIDVLRKSVLEHERLHGVLIFEKMKEIQKQGNDPATLIEPLSGKSSEKDTLVQRADIAITQIEGHLYPEQKSPEYIKIHAEIKSRLSKNPQFNRSGKVWLPDNAGNYREYPIPNFAQSGEDGG